MRNGYCPAEFLLHEVFVSPNWISFVIGKPIILVLDEWTYPRKGVIRCVGNARNVLEGDVVLLHVCEPACPPRRKVWGGFPISQGDVVRVGDDSRAVHVVSPLLEGVSRARNTRSWVG